MSADFDRVELIDVSRHYGRRRAVFRVSLTVQGGEILGLLGPNGAGKSTLLGLLSTLVAPTSGTIRYGGRTSSDDGPGIRARIGVLAHELHLYSELSARQNLEFFARLYNLEPEIVVLPALERAGLVDRADDAVGSFSRGMRQRLALERALLHAPRLVLLDEPFTGLDDRAVGLVGERLGSLAASGAIVIAATHDLDLAEGLVTRVAVMRDGRLVSDERADAGLRSRYRVLLHGQPEAESGSSKPRASEAAAVSGSGPQRQPEAESGNAKPRTREAAAASGSGPQPHPEGESGSSNPRASEAASTRGGGPPRK